MIGIDTPQSMHGYTRYRNGYCDCGGLGSPGFLLFQWQCHQNRKRKQWLVWKREFRACVNLVSGKEHVFWKERGQFAVEFDVGFSVCTGVSVYQSSH